MQSAKEAASNIAASAKSGMDKTKAVAQEKMERMTAHDPMQKEMATERKEEKINQAELNKQQTREHNAAAKHMSGTTGGTTHTAGIGGAQGHSTGMHQMSALPGHGTGQPAGHVTEGTAGAHPIGTNTGTGATLGGGTLGTNPRAGGETNQGYNTGGSARP